MRRSYHDFHADTHITIHYRPTEFSSSRIYLHDYPTYSYSKWHKTPLIIYLNVRGISSSISFLFLHKKNIRAGSTSREHNTRIDPRPLSYLCTAKIASSRPLANSSLNTRCAGNSNGRPDFIHDLNHHQRRSCSRTHRYEGGFALRTFVGRGRDEALEERSVLACFSRTCHIFLRKAGDNTPSPTRRGNLKGLPSTLQLGQIVSVTPYLAHLFFFGSACRVILKTVFEPGMG